MILSGPHPRRRRLSGKVSRCRCIDAVQCGRFRAFSDRRCEIWVNQFSADRFSRARTRTREARQQLGRTSLACQACVRLFSTPAIAHVDCSGFSFSSERSRYASAAGVKSVSLPAFSCASKYSSKRDKTRLLTERNRR